MFQHQMIQTASISPLQRRVQELEPHIGHTPLMRLASLCRPGVDVYAKLEWHQLSGSVKARAAYAMIRDAVEQGLFGQGTFDRGTFAPASFDQSLFDQASIDQSLFDQASFDQAGNATPKRILDATSGNTGIAMAAIGARLGIPVTLCLPANASTKRKEMLRAFGAETILTSAMEGTDGAQQKARELASAHPDLYMYLDQYNNTANRRAHETGTSQEILQAVTPTHFVAGLGTTGTFNGTTVGLKRQLPDLTAIALQPDSPMHGLEGWKHLETAVVPGIHDPSIADEVRLVNSRVALDMLRRIALHEGLLLSPSAAANAVGAAQLADELFQQGKEATIVTVFADDLSKYDEVYQQLWPGELVSSTKVSRTPNQATP